MTAEQIELVLILTATIGLFLWGRWRYDVVALLALLASVAVGVVPPDEAFRGFSHPAVVTVATVLVVSFGLQNSGLVQHLSRYLAFTRHSPTLHISSACGMTAVLSAFMNNTGALALMLPVVLRTGRRSGLLPSMVLMPIAFASLLGGLITLIGTPPNIIVAAVRAEQTGEPFSMFDFTYVGLPIALAGMLYVCVIGWRLLPVRNRVSDQSRERLRIDDYVYQATVPEESRLVGQRVLDLRALCANEISVIAILRGRRRILNPHASLRFEAEDILILEGEEEALRPLIAADGLVQFGAEPVDPELLRSPDVRVIEVVIMPGSLLAGASTRALRLHQRYGINLLAVARQGRPAMIRLGSIRFRVGDLLLLHGSETTFAEVLPALRCLPLQVQGPVQRLAARAWVPIAIFTGAIVLVATGVAPAPLAFLTGAVALVLSNSISVRDVYQNIEWPVVVLLGALIPLGHALDTTGVTRHISATLIGSGHDVPIAMILGSIVVASMLLSDLIHNSPAAVLMAPVGIGIANELSLGPDAFLMAVAIGAASPYLTPIGHPSNMLVLGPGGYRFGDYWRLGLPLDVLIVLASVPLIMFVWL